MNIDSRSLQRRNQLRQSLPPEDLMEHRHSYWRHQDYTLWGTMNERIDSVTYTAGGQVIRLSPIVLMYATKVEWLVTTTFAGGGDTYTLKLDVGGEVVEETIADASTHGLTVIDVSESFRPFFQNFEDVDVEFSAKVSLAITPVQIYGVTLRFTLWERDSFGDYAKPTTRLLTEPYLSTKAWIQRYDKLSDEFTYLSGLRL